MFYLLAFIINVSNFEPVVSKNCIFLSGSAAQVRLEEAVQEFETANFSCEKNKNTLVHNCRHKTGNLIGKVLLMKDKNECKTFPKKIAQDLKVLTGR